MRCKVTRANTSATSQNTRETDQSDVDPTKFVKIQTSRQTQAGIGHSSPAHRGGHVQNRSRRGEQRRGRQRTSPSAEQPQTDGRPSRNAKACLHRLRLRRQPRARRRRHTKKKHLDQRQELQLYAPRVGGPSASAGSRRNGTRQAVAATTGVRSEGNAASNTADA